MSDFRILTQSEFSTQMRNSLIANQDKITDFNAGSAIDTQLVTMGTMLNQAQVKASGGYKKQFEKLPFEIFQFDRRGELFASATEVFSIPVIEPEDIFIPKGTIVGTSGGLQYTTQEDGLVLAGNTDSNAINIIANQVGDSSNVDTGVINILNSSIPKISAVTNNTAATGGRNKESNGEYYARFNRFLIGLAGSNSLGIWTAANSVDTIQSAYIEDNIPPESGIYNFTVYVDDGSGSVPQDKLDEVFTVIKGNDTALIQGYAAAGINFRVLAANLVPVTVAYTVAIDPNGTSAADIEALIDDAVKNYINSLWVGLPVIWSEVNRIIKTIDGVNDVEILLLNGGTANIDTLPSQVSRVSTITGTVS